MIVHSESRPRGASAGLPGESIRRGGSGRDQGQMRENPDSTVNDSGKLRQHIICEFSGEENMAKPLLAKPWCEPAHSERTHDALFASADRKVNV